MTTICYDGKTLAADTRGTGNGGEMILQSEWEKIHFPKEGDYWEIMDQRVLCFGLAGDTSGLHFVKELLQQGVNHKTKVTGTNHADFSVLAVTENASVYSWYYTKNENKSIDYHGINLMTGNFAIGSGAVFATALLSVGKTAKEAVECTGRLDPGTGGRTSVFEIPPPVTVRSVRPVPEEDVPKYTLAEVKDFLDRRHPKEPDPVPAAPAATEEEHPAAEIQAQPESPTV